MKLRIACSNARRSLIERCSEIGERRELLGRRADHTREELTELVISTGSDLIAQDGLEHLTTRKIGARIGYSHGSIYNVVPNLNALISLISARTLRKLVADLSKLEFTGDAMEDARLVLDCYLAFQERHPNLWAATIQHGMREEIEPNEELAVALEETFSLAERVLAPLFEGRAPGEAKVAVRVLWASLQGITSLPSKAKVLTKDGGGKIAMSRNLLETYLRGVSRLD